MNILISYIGLKHFGIFLGDAITCLQTAFEIRLAYPNDNIYLILHPKGEFNKYFIDFANKYGIKILYHEVNNYRTRVKEQDDWRKKRKFRDIQFDMYVELYPRLEGGPRQGALCGYEKGLGRQGTIEYYYYGQENTKELSYKLQSVYGIYNDHIIKERDIFYAPYEKCHGNSLFTLPFHDIVIMSLIDKGYKLTLNVPIDQYRHLEKNCKIVFPPANELITELKKHRLVICGNTGIGWAALFANVSLIALESRHQNLKDYNFFRHDNSSLYAFLEKPNVDLLLFYVDSFFDRVHTPHFTGL